MTEQEMQSEIEKLKKVCENLEDRVGLLMLKVQSRSETPDAQPIPKTKKVTQYILGQKSYFCETPAEERNFEGKHPGVKIEKHKIELDATTADNYLNDPENKKEFVSAE